jgi:xylulokinase
VDRTYLLGVDFGGSASKATLLSDEGKVVATASTECALLNPREGWVEQDPEEIYGAFVAVVRAILESSGIRPSSIAAISLDAATHTAVLLDDRGEPARHSIYWTDRRSVRQSDFLVERWGKRIMELCLNGPSPLWTLPQLMWIRDNEPEIHSKIAEVLFVKDFVRYRLTGTIVTDSIDAMGSLLLDVEGGRWSGELCALAGLEVSALPPIAEPTDIVGRVSAAAARETGLAEGTPVLAGATDTVMEVYASGAISPGQATVKLATAGRICPVTDRSIPHPMLVNYRHIVPGLWYPGTATKSCAASFRWYRDLLGKAEIEGAGRAGESAYSLLDREAATIPPGSDGLFFHPYLQGEMTPYLDNDLRGSFTGLSSFHGRAHFTRAVLEGVAYSLLDCMETLRILGVEPSRASIIGGGASSPLWRSIVADVLGIELVKNENDDSSLGSAMLAGVATGVFASFQDSVDACVRAGETLRPSPEAHAIYAEKFLKYKRIHDALAPVYRGESA